VSLTAQQPVNNVVRTAVEALAAVLGGTNSLHTNALDETLALPTDEAAEIALRTQQVLMEETGVDQRRRPARRSWYVEALTDRSKRRRSDLQRIRDMGGDGTITSGILRGIEDGWFMAEIADSAFAYQRAAGEGREEDRRAQLPHHDQRPRIGDPADLPRGRGRTEEGTGGAARRP
jgi:methylmalonyl-CoA mutase N-terminal domain/subunit